MINKEQTPRGLSDEERQELNFQVKAAMDFLTGKIDRDEYNQRLNQGPASLENPQRGIIFSSLVNRFWSLSRKKG